MEFEREESWVSPLGSALFSIQAFPPAVPWLGAPVLLPPFLHQLLFFFFLLSLERLWLCRNE